LTRRVGRMGCYLEEGAPLAGLAEREKLGGLGLRRVELVVRELGREADVHMAGTPAGGLECFEESLVRWRAEGVTAYL
jgi:hypothetical protein